MDPEKVLQPGSPSNPVEDLGRILHLLDELRIHVCDYHEGMLDSAMMLLDLVQHALLEGDEPEGEQIKDEP